MRCIIPKSRSLRFYATGDGRCKRNPSWSPSAHPRLFHVSPAQEPLFNRQAAAKTLSPNAHVIFEELRIASFRWRPWRTLSGPRCIVPKVWFLRPHFLRSRRTGSTDQLRVRRSQLGTFWGRRLRCRRAKLLEKGLADELQKRRKRILTA